MFWSVIDPQRRRLGPFSKENTVFLKWTRINRRGVQATAIQRLGGCMDGRSCRGRRIFDRLF